ncbi:MAG: diguanylate cyclase [Pseudomonadota bacterium]
MEKMFARATTMGTSTRQRLSERLLTPPKFLQTTADEVVRATRYHRPLSVALVQIDDLQGVRQRDGEEAARAVFVDVIARIIHAMRAPDYIGRLGPGQLGLLMPETGLKQAGIAVGRMQKLIEMTSILTPVGECSATLSAGIAGLSARMRDPKAFLMSACFELRRAQSQGKNTVCLANPDFAVMTVNRSGQVH